MIMSMSELPELCGRWKMIYTAGCVNPPQSPIIDVNEDGTFFQQMGSYHGRWHQNGSYLNLQFTSLILAKEEGPIRLQCELDSAKKAYHGSKSHPDYVNGTLYCNGSKI